MSLATAFVLTLSSAISYLIHQYLLVPLELGYLRTISFILVIAVSVQFTEIMVRRLSPLLDQVLGIYIPLIATNCAVLGGAGTVCFATRTPGRRRYAACVSRYRDRVNDRRHHVTCIHGFLGHGAPMTPSVLTA
jgi:hypothetical protein